MVTDNEAERRLKDMLRLRELPIYDKRTITAVLCEIKRLRAAIKAFDDLCCAYRTGTQPSGKVLDTLWKFRKQEAPNAAGGERGHDQN